MGKIKLLGGRLPIKERWDKLSRRVRRALLAMQLISLSIYAIYLAYEIATGAFIVFKSILLGATVAYAIFYIIEHDKLDKPSKAKKKAGKRIYTLTKIAVKGCTLALTFFGIFAATVTTTFWSVTLAIAMLIGWVFSLIFEILSWLVDRRVRKIKEQTARQAQAARENAKKKYDDTKKRAQDTYNNAKNRVTNGAKRAKDGVSKIANGVKEKAHSGAAKVKSLFAGSKTDLDSISAPEADTNLANEIPAVAAGDEE